MPETQEIMTRKEAAEYLRLSVNTLANWASTGSQPLPFVRLGARQIRYRKTDLDAFAEANLAGGKTTIAATGGKKIHRRNRKK